MDKNANKLNEDLEREIKELREKNKELTKDNNLLIDKLDQKEEELDRYRNVYVAEKMSENQTETEQMSAHLENMKLKLLSVNRQHELEILSIREELKEAEAKVASIPLLDQEITNLKEKNINLQEELEQVRTLEKEKKELNRVIQ